MLWRQDHKSGTAAQSHTMWAVICKCKCNVNVNLYSALSQKNASNMVSSGGYWRHFYSYSEATAQCELFLTAPNRNILTYLLTYSCRVIEKEWTERLTDTEAVVVRSPPAWLDALTTSRSTELVSSSTRQRADGAVQRRASGTGSWAETTVDERRQLRTSHLYDNNDNDNNNNDRLV